LSCDIIYVVSIAVTRDVTEPLKVRFCLTCFLLNSDTEFTHRICMDAGYEGDVEYR